MENHQNTDEYIKCKGEASELASGKNTLDNDQCETVERATKRQKIRERQWRNGKTNQTVKEGTFQDRWHGCNQNRQGRENESCTPEYAVGQNNGD